IPALRRGAPRRRPRDSRARTGVLARAPSLIMGPDGAMGESRAASIENRERSGIMIPVAARHESASPGFASDEDRWGAVVRRDRRADGLFYYAVQTTGVYCRPSCAARRARRENVRFYAADAEAERAGFRPCKRCRPNEPRGRDERAAAVARACRPIGAAADPPGLESL